MENDWGTNTSYVGMIESSWLKMRGETDTMRRKKKKKKKKKATGNKKLVGRN